jgi:hypothetical protein
MEGPEYPYYWSWGPGFSKTAGAERTLDRKGERCRVLARSKRMNSAAIEFESDRYRAVVSRNGLRRVRKEE